MSAYLTAMPWTSKYRSQEIRLRENDILHGVVYKEDDVSAVAIFSENLISFKLKKMPDKLYSNAETQLFGISNVIQWNTPIVCVKCNF